jgi:nucleotide-binding universal stress UspA family protein
VTASWRVEENDALRRILFHARHNDLTVVGRARKPNGLPPDFVELLLVNCGRPVLIASSTPPRTLTGTIMVCWKETADAARAVAAAMPFLIKAKRAVFTSVVEGKGEVTDATKEIIHQIAWNGVAAEANVIAANGRSPQELLSAAAETCGADLIVMGAYGHSRMREMLFGGCTQTFIKQADRPVLMMH